MISWKVRRYRLRTFLVLKSNDMRSFIKYLFFILSSATSFTLSAYEPTTTWPYYFDEFQSGHITTYQAAPIEYDKLNINLVNGRVHYVKDGVIMEVAPATVALLVIGDVSFVNIGGRMNRVLLNTSHSAVVESVSVDVDAMSKTDIGYGKSSLASAQNVSATALSAMVEFSLNRSIDEVSRGKESGDRLELKRIPGLVYKGVFVPASRNEILAIPGIDKDKVKAYLKNEKIKFRATEDLARLLDYLYSI